MICSFVATKEPKTLRANARQQTPTGGARLPLARVSEVLKMGAKL